MDQFYGAMGERGKLSPADSETNKHEATKQQLKIT